MANERLSVDDSCAAPSANATSKNYQRVIWRIIQALSLSRRLKAEREVARILGIPGTKFTDEIERRIMEHYSRHRGFRS